MKIKFLVPLLGIILFSCKKPVRYDLIIENAKVFDANTGKVLDDKTILIGADTIAGIIDAGEPVRTKKVIDADGRLVTPGYIETHTHLTYAFYKKGKVPERIQNFIAHFYHKRFSDLFLPYGVTTVMDMGQPEGWLPKTLSWTESAKRRFFNVFFSGSALTSSPDMLENNNYVLIENPDSAKQKVINYHNKGISHVYLSLLYESAFISALKTADSLNMVAYGQVEKPFLSVERAIQLGLKNFERIHTIPFSVFDEVYDGNAFKGILDSVYGSRGCKVMDIYYLEKIRYVMENRADKLDDLLQNIVKSNLSFSFSSHSLAQQFGETWFRFQDYDSISNLNEEEILRNRENLRLYMQLLKKISDNGIKLRIGTDCPDGGKAFLSEQLLLAETGFTISDIIKISSVNGAEALGIAKDFGSIDVGKKADLIIYDQNPFDNYKNFLSKKRVIKSGHLYRTIKRRPGAMITGNQE